MGNPVPPATSTLASAEAVYELTSILDRVDLEKVFYARQPLEVELGCGDGSFLANYAKANPNRNFLGIERLKGRVSKLTRKGRRLGLNNLRGIRIESTYFLEYLLPAGSASALHIYFPDPWPKRRHWQNRLVNDRFPQLASQALEPGGRVFLRTDDRPYYAQMLEVFTKAGPAQFVPEPTPAELLAIVTDFERGFQAKGIPTLHACYRKV